MSVTSVKLKDRAADRYVDAELHTNLAIGDMIASERRWQAERSQIAAALEAAGVPDNDQPQHLHWNWEAKLAGDAGLDIGGPLSPYRLMGVRIRGDDHWQGLVLATLVGYRERLDARGRDVLYIKYLETAPWNLVIEELGQQGRYGGVGPQRIRASIALSRALELRGRFGLHALPQAESFYRNGGMTDLGIDWACEGLRYFEMSEGQATAYLTKGKGNAR